VLTGRCDDPPRDGIGCKQFEGVHLEQLRDYLLNPPKPGRRPARQLATA